jgi:hypothetical protein
MLGVIFRDEDVTYKYMSNQTHGLQELAIVQISLKGNKLLFYIQLHCHSDANLKCSFAAIDNRQKIAIFASCFHKLIGN